MKVKLKTSLSGENELYLQGDIIEVDEKRANLMQEREMAEILDENAKDCTPQSKKRSLKSS